MTQSATATRSPYAPDPDALARARKADLRIDRLIESVRTMTMYIRPSDEFCHGCAWERYFKRHVVEVAGWSRTPSGRPRSDADEAWLRSSQAYDAVADAVLAILWTADPGNGHGFSLGRAQ